MCAKLTAVGLIHTECAPTLPSQEQWLSGSLLFYLSLFSPLEGDETAEVSVSCLLMDTVSNAGSSFEGQDMVCPPGGRG